MPYPTEAPLAGPGGRVVAVQAHGPAERAGLRANDIVVAVDGQPVRDIIDWMWGTDGDSVTVTVRTPDGDERQTVLRRAWDEPWGIEFSGVVFDGIRECDNACAFCFVAQLPDGMRPSLHVRDDDFRLSFLAGNFVTLTNLTDTDVGRIIGQRLSPMHVSLHAVDEDVRRRLMCPGSDDRALEFLDRLERAGIELHVQIVLVPGINDGEVLERSLEWLALREGVQSVGIVPVGVTRYQHRISRTFDDPAAAAAVLEQIQPWRERMRAERGMLWVHAADELHLTAGTALPEWDDYDGFPQFENGIGMVRAFIDEAAEAVAGLAPHSDRCVHAPFVTLVTGAFFAPVLRSLVPELTRAGCSLEVLAVANDLLGGDVGVAGLLGGGDIARAVATCAPTGVVLVPDVAVNDDGLFLDDLTLPDVANAAGADVRLVSCDAAGLVSALQELSTAKSG